MVIIIQSIFAIIYLLMKRAVVSFYKFEQSKWDEIKASYYWLEYAFIFTATIVTPKHTYNEGIITLIAVLVIKFYFDKMTFIDEWLDRKFHR